MKSPWLTYIIAISTVVLTACSGQDNLKDEISSKETQLKEASENQVPGEALGTEGQEELIELLYSYYVEYPEDSAYAATCLDKIHMAYSAMGDYEKSAMYGDTLLNYYKNYINRPMILESQANNYDFFIKPRDTAKVRYYNELLLEENPDLPDEKCVAIQDRLDNLHLTLEELILKNNE